MKLSILIYLSVFLLLGTKGQGQQSDPVNNPKLKRVSEAYQFIIEQDYSINKIQKQLPDLKPAALKARSAFTANFGKSKDRMKLYLLEHLQEKAFTSFQKKILAKLGKSKDLQSFTKAKAYEYLSKVESRAKGKIESPVLATLLSFNYQDSPHQEILNGFSRLYSTQNHPKAQGINWRIKVPVSWKETEGRGPSAIQKITSDYGDGNQAIVLMIKDAIPPGSPAITEKEIHALLNEKGMRTTISAGGKFISFKKVQINKQPVGLMEYEIKVPGPVREIKIRIVEYLFIREDKMCFLQCATTSDNPYAVLTKEVQRAYPLFNLVANSSVISR